MTTNRRQVWVVINDRNIWKGLFFMREEKAFDAVKRFYGRHLPWRQISPDTIKCSKLTLGSKSFKVKPIKEYRTIGDVSYSNTTKFLKGEDHK